jgi:hypothetical protein
MADFNKTDIASALKEWYSSKDVADTCYDHNFLLKTLKRTKCEGNQYVAPLKYGRNRGFGSTVTVANAAAGSAKYEKWEVPEKKFYQAVYIDGAAIQSAKRKGPGAFFDVIKEAIDDGRKNAASELERMLFRNTNNARGVIGSVSGTSLVLANIDDVVNFEVGDTLVTAPTEGGTLETGSKAITAIDRDTGTLTCASSWASGISTIAAGQYVFKANEQTTGLNGLLGHTPITRTSSTTVQGIDLSTDWTRLAGVKFNSAGRTVQQTLIDGLARSSREGGMPKQIVLNPSKFAQLAVELGSQRVYDNSKAEFGFTGLTLATPTGALPVYSAGFCPSDYGWAMPEDLEIVHWGDDLIFFADEDQLLHLDPAADRYYVRLCIMADLVVPRPVDVVLFNFAA